MTDITGLPSWTLTIPLGRPVTMNKERGKNVHWSEAAATTKVWREGTFWRAKQARIPKLDRIGIAATPLYKNRRNLPDVMAVAPSVKAAIDGLVDAEVIPDDTADHLLEVISRPPVVTGIEGLQLIVYDLDSVAPPTHDGMHMIVPLSKAVYAELIRRCGTSVPERLAAAAAGILADTLTPQENLL